MNGIVSLLDAQHDELVSDLWAELDERFGVRGVYATPYAHFSYQVAPSYRDLNAVAVALQNIATASRPFTVRTCGLGVFTGAAPVVYIQVVRNAALDHLHQRIWSALAPLAEAPLAYYAIENWVAHITLAMGDVSHEVLSAMMEYLQHRPFYWQLGINSLAFIHNDGTRQRLAHAFVLG